MDNKNTLSNTYAKFIIFDINIMCKFEYTFYFLLDKNLIIIFI